MSEVKCICVEFPNEENAVAVGYSDWVQLPPNKSMSDIILTSEEVTIRWPNIAITPPTKSVMRKYASTSTKWSKSVGIILAEGEWIDMCAKCLSLEEHRVLEVDKKDRKVIKNRSSTEFDDNGINNQMPVQSENSLKQKQTIMKRKIKMKKTTEIDELEKQEKMFKSKREITDSSLEGSLDTSSDDGLGLRSSKTTLIDRIQILKAQKERMSIELEKLKKENEHLHTIIDVNDMINKIKLNSNSLKENIKKCLSYSQRTTTAVKSSKINLEPSSSQQKALLQVEKSKNAEEDIKMKRIQENVDNVGNNEAQVLQSTHNEVLNSSNHLFNDLLESVDNSGDNTVQVLQNTKNEVLNSGGQLFNEFQFQKLNHANIKDFVNSAISIMFDRKTLSTSTLTGGVPHCYSNLPNRDMYTKAKLDPEKVQIICDYVNKNVHPPGKSLSKEEKDKMVRSTITQKTNNARNPCRKLPPPQLNVNLSPNKNESPSKTVNVAFNIST